MTHRERPNRAIDARFAVFSAVWIGLLLWLLNGTWLAAVYGAACGLFAAGVAFSMRKRIGTGAAAEGRRSQLNGASRHRPRVAIAAAVLCLAAGGVVVLVEADASVLAVSVAGLTLTMVGVLVAFTFGR
jgi:hypothetical protein